MDNNNSNKQANNHSKIVSFVWQIADDVLRDIIERSDYRDVILPMVLLRRIDVLLEKSKQQVLEASKSNQEQRKRLGITASPDADDKQLFSVSGYNFYNLHDKMLKELPTGYENNPNGLYEEIKVYVSKFSKDIRDIIEKADLLDKLKTLTLSKSALRLLIKKFTDKSINLSNEATEDVNGNILPAMTNADMGMILEELVRKFNEANNGTAGEHFTPRDAVELLSRLIFEPVEKLPASISIYDPACGTGGMLTASHEYLINNKNVKDEAIRLSGNEINSQSYAICKADMIIKGSRSDQIRNCNTILDNDQDKEGNRFGYIISNPPYGKSWKNEQETICNGKEFKSGKFTYELYNFKGITIEATKAPRVSDGQLLFLLELIDKMYPLTKQAEGCRAAIIFNGSSLFTGNAGQGESNIRRYVVENDYVEAIIQLPNNIFYNTGIATYVWVITNKKADNRKGKIQLIDASKAFKKLRKSLGNKNCEITPEHQDAILKAYMNFKKEENELTNSKIFDNDDFRYYSVKINRPLRLRCQFNAIKINEMRFSKTKNEESKYIYNTYGQKVYKVITDKEKNDIKEYFEEAGIKVTKDQLTELVKKEKWDERKKNMELATKLMPEIGEKVFMDYNEFVELLKKTAAKLNLKVKDKDIKTIAREMSEIDPEAKPVIKETVTTKKAGLQELINGFGIDKNQLSDYGYFTCKEKDKYVVYEADKNLSDVEKIPIKQDIYEYFCTEVKPYASDAWVEISKVEIGCEISFNKYFYKPAPLRTLAENEADIRKLDAESQGFIQSLFDNK